MYIRVNNFLVKMCLSNFGNQLVIHLNGKSDGECCVNDLTAFYVTLNLLCLRSLVKPYGH